MREFLGKNKYIIAIIIIYTIFIGTIYLDNTKNAHDLQFHLANIKNIMSNNLKIDLIMPNIGNNLGYGLYIFYPMLTHFTYAIISSILSIINIDLIDSVLITNILISILSGISMYILVLKTTESKIKASMSTIIYLLFPYRMGTITVRMALAENFAAIFLPIILLGLYYLFKDEKKKFYICFVIGYVGLIFSHYLISMYFSIFVFIILLFYIDKIIKNKRIITLGLGVLGVVILVLPNIVIFAEHYGMEYLVYKENYVTNFALIKANLLEGRDYIIPSANYDWTVPYYIYFSVICLSIYSAYLIVKEHKRGGILLLSLIRNMLYNDQFRSIMGKLT